MKCKNCGNKTEALLSIGVYEDLICLDCVYYVNYLRYNCKMEYEGALKRTKEVLNYNLMYWFFR